MRIVNVGIVLFVVLMATIPLLGTGFTPYAAGQALGMIVLAFVVGAVFAAIAWFASGREEPAREAGFGIGALLVIAVALTPLLFSPSKREILDAGGDEIDAIASPDEYLRDHPFAKADPDSDKGRAYAALTVFFEDVGQRVYEFDRASNQALAFDLVRIARATSVEELQQAQAAAERYAEAAKNQKAFLADIDTHLNSHLKSHGVDYKIRKRMLADFESRELRSLAAMKTHELLAGHIVTLLGIFVDEWGKWTIDQSAKSFVFQSRETTESFNTLVRLIEDCEQMLKRTTPDSPSSQ